MLNPKHIAVLVGAERQYNRGVLKGIAGYARLHAEWVLDAEPTLPGSPVTLETLESADGAILPIIDEHTADVVRRWKRPVVNLASCFPEAEFAHVSNDGAGIATLAIEHFVERGFRRFAFCELDSFSRFRARRFEEQLAARGFPAEVFRVDLDQHDQWKGHDRRALEDWLTQLPKPIAILAHNDVRGRHLADACRRLQIEVPDQVAILGVDNESPHCEMCNPSLSSIETASEQIGFEAARLLDQLLNGETLSRHRLLIPPLRVVTRQSTDVTATADAAVAQAVRFIRKFACKGIDVSDVLKDAAISRAVLERRFVKALGRTPHDEILRVRLNRAKELLAETTLPIEVIAERTGFRHGEYLGVVFRREQKQTPGEFRAQSRALAQTPMPNGQRHQSSSGPL